jgi:ketosteroid isomerase-like protein
VRDDPQEITDLIRAWVSAVRAGEPEGVLSAHAEDIVMFDVPPPDNGVRGSMPIVRLGRRSSDGFGRELRSTSSSWT